jgi:hypothetical protein
VITYPDNFNSTARRALHTLLGFAPPWSLSGRAALWWRTCASGPTQEIALVWHGRALVGCLLEDIQGLLDVAGLKSGVLLRGPRRVWLIVRDSESACTLKLAAEPETPLARSWQTWLHGQILYVDSWPDILQAILDSLDEDVNVDDLWDLYLLLRSGIALEPGLREAQRRDPGFDPQRIALGVARLEVQEEDLPEPGLARFRRFQEKLVFQILSLSDPDPADGEELGSEEEEER